MIGIDSLFEPRLRFDLIQFYKKQNELNVVNWLNSIRKRPSIQSTGLASKMRGLDHAIEKLIIRNCEALARATWMEIHYHVHLLFHKHLVVLLLGISWFGSASGELAR